ncbi:MAG: FAD-dependent oxidoreductase [Deltaproteobacteria bacterium]|nr:FAD-dependent oxidoreductase [Deltaproteobacteria bacterium]
MTKDIVIIGGVAAGPKTACRLKRLDPKAHITIIDQDNLISYGGCGIPYFVSGDVSDEKELRSTSFHVLRDTDFFHNAKGVEVLIRTQVRNIDRRHKQVNFTSLDSGVEDSLPYDKLVICTGSTPNNPPIPGSNLAGVHRISDMHQAIAIKEKLARGKVSRAVVIGAGAIGIEMAESFADLWEIETTIIEFMPQILPKAIDPVFAMMLTHHLQEHGVQVLVSEGVKKIEEAGGAYKVTTDKHSLDADIIIMAVGVHPRSELAGEAGLLVGAQGGIIVNNRLQTSDPDIYAAGDCIEVPHLVSGEKTNAPFGSLANRQGRIVADNLAGIPSIFPGVTGTFIMKAFASCIGCTGLSLEAALASGFDADSVITAQSDRAHFFPTQAVIPLQMVFDKRTRRVLGVQGFGPMTDAVLARIDSAAALIGKGGSVEDFSNLEMAYAPPFSTAIDALNATANAADNLIDGRLRTVNFDDFMAWMDKPESRPDWLALDVRHPSDAKLFKDKFQGHWLTIPYIEVRQRAADIPADKTIIIICDAGTRSSEVQCYLDSIGKTDSLVLGGGFNIMRRIAPSWWPS